jgi:hypothetical protein
MANTTFLMVKDGKYIGNTTGRVDPTGLDGYVAIYPSKSPLMIKAVAVEGFRAEGPEKDNGIKYAVVIMVAGAFFLAAYAVIWFRNRQKK